MAQTSTPQIPGGFSFALLANSTSLQGVVPQMDIGQDIGQT
jgi:hypothetical protein